jgi:hypothetical protein
MLCLWIIVSSVISYGSPGGHGPFQKGEEPLPVSLADCKPFRSEYKMEDETNYPGILYFRAPGDTRGAILKMERMIKTNDCYWCILVLDRKGRPISTLATNDMASYVYSVYSADLNQDGQADFLVNIWTGASGLAGEGSTTTFLLSSGTRYVALDWYNHDFEPEDIVRFKKGGPSYFINNELISNGDEKTKDGRDHNFWVYQLYRFSGSKMVEANRDDPRFPKWVWYTIKENHRETDQLTAEQKKRILRNK